MDVVKPLMSASGSLTEALVIAATRSPTKEEGNAGTLTPYDAIENLLKGPEVSLGDGRGYLDKDDNPRYRARFRWWDPKATTLDRGALIPPKVRSLVGAEFPQLAAEPIVDQVPAPYTDEVPVVFGHYWCNPEFEVLGAEDVMHRLQRRQGRPARGLPLGRQA